ncbi:sodium-dependent transporter [Melioribacter sp. OK-6-Me]|uniref:sodium-dependent transporter n=1 Tax=unclassified Melioribacter TaxID=2627329 RepID=UPI003EDB600F
MIPKNSEREQWGSRVGFILAAAGSAIGLGNIWRFPYLSGENGGAAFIFVYIFCVILIGIPVLIAEVLIGRSTQKNPVGSFKSLHPSSFWQWIGGIGVIAGFVILSFYTVVAGWTLGYIYEAINGNLQQYSIPDAAQSHFSDLLANVYWNVGLLAAFMLLTMAIVYFGVQKGIERGSKIMMPMLFILMLIIMVRGLTLEGASKGLAYLFNPDWSKITTGVVLAAMGQAFFSMSLGMGAMLTYGSYMSKRDNIPYSTVWIAFLDTLLAIIAGISIFTVVFATGQNPDVGPSLIFRTLPVVFTKIPGGFYFSILFFIALSLAAVTSTVSLLEVVTAYFVDEKGWSRKKAVVVFGFAALLLGVPSALSFNLLADFKIGKFTFFDLSEFVSSNLLLPIGGFFISIFVGWVWGFDKVKSEIIQGAETFFGKYPWFLDCWKFILRFVAPVLIIVVLLSSIGLI